MCIRDRYISAQPIILLDPGHGRCDHPEDANLIFDGISYNHDTRLRTEIESGVAVGVKLRALIESSTCNWTVHMTRESNAEPGGWMYLIDRRALSNTLGANIFLSIHTNAAGPSANGAETFWCEVSATNSISFAESVHALYTAAVATIGIQDRRVAEWKNFLNASNHLVVLEGDTARCCLSELGFGTNPVEAAKLNNDANRDIFAQAFFEAFQAELGVSCEEGCQQTASIADPNIDGLTEVSEYIVSTGNVPDGNNATFDAGTFIDLQTGFEGEIGSVFEGRIGGCVVPSFGELPEKHHAKNKIPNRLASLNSHEVKVNIHTASHKSLLVFKPKNMTADHITIYSREKKVIAELPFQEEFSIKDFEPGDYYFRFHSDDNFIEHVEKITLM